LDTTFGSPNGFVTYPLTVDPGFPHSGATQDVLVEPGTGKILAVVDITPSPAGSLCPFGLARFLPGGTLDPSFNPGGLHPGIADECVTGTFADAPFAVARTDDGKYVTAGIRGDDILLTRHLANGELDPAFNGDPLEDDRVITDVPGANSVDRVAGVHVAADGKITVAVTADFGAGPPSGTAIVVARYTNTGALDTTFDESPTVAPMGMVFVEGPGDEETGNGMLVDPSGRTVVAGSSFDATPPPATNQTQIFVTRLTSAGTPDTGFSGDGIHEFGLGSAAGPDISSDVLRQPDGRLVLAVSQDPLVTPASFAVAALTDAGALDGGFGTGGSTVAPLVPGPGGGVGEIGVPARIARQPDGKLVLAGNRLVPPGPSFVAAVVRFRADGLVDTTYGSQGVAEPAPFASPNPAISAVDVDAEGRAVVGGVVQSNPFVPLLARFQGDAPAGGGGGGGAAAPPVAGPTGQRAAALKKCKKKKTSRAKKKCKKKAKKLPV
jgi:uncharacterized delta-60 repeat protein